MGRWGERARGREGERARGREGERARGRGGEGENLLAPHSTLNTPHFLQHSTLLTSSTSTLLYS
ncbi:MAG: hypothetical protein KME17_21380 [Cyanosarcina radialis HA8281-LM2]|nr:hypothetical protein [Cyanosarcina radialis HA8281-LM2]